MASNLYCNGTPGRFPIVKMAENRWTSAGSARWRKYSTVLIAIFLAGNSDSGSEYATYNHKLYALLGGTDYC